MLFHFTTFNHCDQGKIILEDLVRIMAGQLKALGHQTSYTTECNFYHDGYNVIVESFADDPKTIERIALAHSKGYRFLYVATEEPTEKGFNHGAVPAMVDRQNAFEEAAKYTDGILHLVPGEATARWFGLYAPTAYVELGYAPGLISNEPDIEPDHDFGFYGSLTWRREEILAKLQTFGTVIKLGGLSTPRLERDQMMRRARVIVQIRATLEMGLVSSTRCATALYMGRPVLAESHEHSAPWDKVIRFSESLPAFYEDAHRMRSAWSKGHIWQMDAFKRHLTPDVCIGEPLRQIGVL